MKKKKQRTCTLKRFLFLFYVTNFFIFLGITDNLHLKPNVFSLFYPKLRANLTSWRAKALWKKFDARASHKCYGKGKLAGSMRVLIIGGGPCGLRTAIEAQLLGAKVVSTIHYNALVAIEIAIQKKFK